jgi:hypothetical protein
MMPALSLLAMAAFLGMMVPARADSGYTIDHLAGPEQTPSSVSIGPADRPGALAKVVFQNEQVNGAPNNGRMPDLDFNGLLVGVRFYWQSNVHGHDAIELTPPDGVVCVPSCFLELPETATGHVYLYSHEAVGM